MVERRHSVGQVDSGAPNKDECHRSCDLLVPRFQVHIHRTRHHLARAMRTQAPSIFPSDTQHLEKMVRFGGTYLKGTQPAFRSFHGA